MQQHIFNVVTPLQPGAQNEVRQLLENADYKGPPPKNDVFGFRDVDALHFASLFIYDDPEDGWRLVFENNVDGERSAYFDALIQAAEAKDKGKFLLKLYALTSFDGTTLSALKRYWNDHIVEPECGHITAPGFSKARILEDATLFDTVDAALGDGCDDRKPADLLSTVLNAVKSNQATAGLLDQEISESGNSLGTKVAASFSLVGNGICFLATAMWNVLRERMADADRQTPDADNVRIMKEREDLTPSNHMVSIVHLHQDTGRQLGKQFGFATLKALATIIYDKGMLGPIDTIHFAHWAKLNSSRRLLFVSNYGGSWDSYLDDFTLKASKGLNLAWAHGVGIPKSWFMLLGGAAQGPEFTDWARRSMVPTFVWYQAYPHIAAPHIHRNAKLRAALKEARDNPQDTGWLEFVS